jgi:hypothetical protein
VDAARGVTSGRCVRRDRWTVSCGTVPVGTCKWDRASGTVQVGAAHVGPCKWEWASGTVQVGPCKWDRASRGRTSSCSFFSVSTRPCCASRSTLSLYRACEQVKWERMREERCKWD